MKTILTPVDFSPATRGVIDASCQLAKDLGARLVLMHCLQPPMLTTDYGVGLEILQETVAVNERAAARQLEHLQDELARRGIAVDTVLVSGPSPAQILDQARRTKADYLVLGSHGHTALYDLLVGSTTHAVLKASPCPVVIVPPAKKKASSKRG